MHSVLLVKTKDTGKTKTAEKCSTGYTSYLSCCMLIYYGYNGLPEYSTGQKNF